MKKWLAGILSRSGLDGTQAQKQNHTEKQDILDFSHVTSPQIAAKLSEEGKLFKILLFPAEFGGTEVPPNVVYVPPGIPEIKHQLTGTLIRFFNEGLINQLKVEPEYKGQSFVPSKIHMRAWHSEKQDGSFEPTIDIW